MQTVFSIRSITMIVVALLAFPLVVGAHEFERGHIERSVDIVIRNRDVQIKYAIGLSDSTILDWLVLEEAIDSQTEQRYRKLVSEFEAENAPVEETKDTGKGPSTTAAAEAAEDTEPAQFQTELQNLLQEKMANKVAGNLKVRFADLDVKLDETNFSNSSRHHVTLEILAKCRIPDDVEAGEFSFKDLNFLEIFPSKDDGDQEEKTPSKSPRPEQEADLKQTSENDQFRFKGNIRMACRVKGRAVLVNSNVAPVLVRAKVTEVGEMDLEHRRLAASIFAKMAFAK